MLNRINVRENLDGLSKRTRGLEQWPLIILDSVPPLVKIRF